MRKAYTQSQNNFLEINVIVDTLSVDAKLLLEVSHDERIAV